MKPLRYTDRKNDPYYYETICCEECGGKEDLLMHRYNESHRCQKCVNTMAADLAHQEAIIEEEESNFRYEYEDEALTLAERQK